MNKMAHTQRTQQRWKKINWAKTKIQSKQKQNEYELEKMPKPAMITIQKKTKKQIVHEKNAQKWVCKKMHANSGKKDLKKSHTVNIDSENGKLSEW